MLICVYVRVLVISTMNLLLFNALMIALDSGTIN